MVYDNLKRSWKRASGIHSADLETAELPAGARIRLTFFWPDAERWESTDLVVLIGDQRKP